jgi:hypothetical protein
MPSAIRQVEWFEERHLPERRSAVCQWSWHTSAIRQVECFEGTNVDRAVRQSSWNGFWTRKRDAERAASMNVGRAVRQYSLRSFERTTLSPLKRHLAQTQNKMQDVRDHAR